MNLVVIIGALSVGFVAGLVVASFLRPKKTVAIEQKDKRTSEHKGRKERRNIYVGNVAEDVTEKDLHDLFKPYGQVGSINIVDDASGDSKRRYAFVAMPNQKEAEKAIEILNDTPFKGQDIKVNRAHQRSFNRRKSGRRNFRPRSHNKKS